MNAPNVRSVTVRLNAEVAKYIADMKMAGKVTDDAFAKVHARMRLLDRDTRAAQSSMAGLSRSALTVDKRLDSAATSMQKLQNHVQLTAPGMQRLRVENDATAVSLRRSGNEIDSLSGRLRLLLELGATTGAGILPIGAAGVAGIGGLAALFGGATVSALGLVAASQGVGDALQAVEKARLEPTVANLEAAHQAMNQISPEAQTFVRRLQEALPLLRGIRDAGAARLFPGLTETIDDLERLEPALTRLMEGIGAGAGDAISDATESLASQRWAPFLEFLAVEAPQSLNTVIELTGSLAHGAAQMWMAFDPTNDSFLDWVTGVADAFDDWASSTEGRQDIQAFLAYAEETGPKVAAFFESIVNLITQLAQAAAPLGGPVLDILTAVAEGAAALADSDLATPVLAAVAAYSALNRVLIVTDSLQRRLTGSAAATTGLAARGGIVGFVGGGARSASASIRQLRGDVGTLATTWATAGTRSERELARMNAAAQRTRSTLAGLGKGAAVLGGITVAASGAADGIGLTNTASLALLGTMMGPWGTALGGTAGLLLDINANMNAFADATLRAQAALESGNPADINAVLAEQQALLAQFQDLDNIDGFGDFFSDSFGHLLNGFRDAGDQADLAQDWIDALEEGLDDAARAARRADKAAAEYAEQQQLEAHIREQAAAADAAAGSFFNLAAAIEKPTLKLERLETRMQRQTDAALNMGENIRKAIRNGADPEALLRLVEDLGPAASLAIEELANGGEKAARRFNASFREMESAAQELRDVVTDLQDLMSGDGWEPSFPRKGGLDPSRFITTDREKVVAELRGLKHMFDTWLPKEVRTEIRASGIPQTEKAVDKLVDKYELTEVQRTALLELMDHASPKIQQIEKILRDYDKQNPDATASVNDQATPKLQGIAGWLNAVDGRHTSSTHTHTTVFQIERRGGAGQHTPSDSLPTPSADGSLWDDGVRRFARGGFGRNGRYYDRVPMLVRGGANILWGEQETGWEAYISGKPGMRDRNLAILSEAAERLGVTVADLHSASPGHSSNVTHRGGGAGRTVRHVLDVRVTGEMDLQRAKAQIVGIARDVAVEEIEFDADWRGGQGLD